MENLIEHQKERGGSDPRVLITKRKQSAFMNNVKNNLSINCIDSCIDRNQVATLVDAIYNDNFPQFNVRLAKSRFQKFSKALETALPDQFEMVSNAFKKAFQFDPDAKIYTPEIGQKAYARLKERCEESGQTMYKLMRTYHMNSFEKQQQQLQLQLQQLQLQQQQLQLQQQ